MRFRVALLLILLNFVFFLGNTNIILAEEGEVYAPFPYYDLEVPIGSKTLIKNIADYINTIYTFIISIVGVVATAMIMYGGLKWVLAAGNQNKIGEAKETITAAVIGLVLALCSYLILGVINPDLVGLSEEAVPLITLPETGECSEDACNSEINPKGPGDDQCSGLTAVNTAYTQAVGNAYLKLNPAAAKDWDTLAKAYYDKFGKAIPVVHMFRNPDYQCCLQFKSDADNPASSCTSPHVNGYGVDINTSALSQEEYNFIVCGRTDTCTDQGFHNFTVLNYNADKEAGRISEQHHFNHASHSSYCSVCPYSNKCSCTPTEE